VGDISKHFSLSEFFSPNDKGKTFKARKPEDKLLRLLEDIREGLGGGKELRIESGIRSVEHNARQKGSAPNSEHLFGRAADIYVSGMTNKQLGAAIQELYRKGRLPDLSYSYLIKGTSNTRVHVDVGRKRTSIWGPGY
jgi:uncharacterized protein YcbK (DUF882 family)